MDRGRKLIMIDMENVDFIDGSGLQAFDAINRRALEKGGRIGIKGLQGDVKKMFELAQMWFLLKPREANSFLYLHRQKQ